MPPVPPPFCGCYGALILPQNNPTIWWCTPGRRGVQGLLIRGRFATLLIQSSRCDPHILSILKNFGSFSGYKLNYNTSEFYPINRSAKRITQAEILFRVSTTGFKYLGIQINSYPSLASANFTPLMDKVKSDLQRWDSLPISLAGRIQSVKMILPKFSYLFQCIPIFLPKSFFKTLDQTVSTFIWQGKRPRIKCQVLQRTRNSGGLAMPNYYWAANVQKISYWLSHHWHTGVYWRLNLAVYLPFPHWSTRDCLVAALR